MVTGAGSGFGAGIAERFAQEGAKIMVADIDPKAAETCATPLSGAKFFKVDVSKDHQVKALTDATLEAFGWIDILVNNAGIAQVNHPMLNVDEAAFDRLFAVKVKSICLTAKHMVPHIIGRQGNIINIASTGAVSPRAGLTWFNSTKSAVKTLTRSMAMDLAPERVRVNAINPVFGATGLTVDFMGGVDDPEIRENLSPPSLWDAYQPPSTLPTPPYSLPQMRPVL